jgi:prepilin-type processing-associated H-X9-DG protein
MKNQPIYGCPDSTPILATSNGNQNTPAGYPLGYGVNQNIMVDEYGSLGLPATPSVSMTSIQTPAETILIADAAGIWVGDGGYAIWQPDEIDGPNPNNAYDTPYTWGIHTKLANIGWVDGHAKSSHITLRPNGSYYEAPSYAQYAQQYNIGDVMNPLYPYGTTWADYYYSITKPN